MHEQFICNLVAVKFGPKAYFYFVQIQQLLELSTVTQSVTQTAGTRVLVFYYSDQRKVTFQWCCCLYSCCNTNAVFSQPIVCWRDFQIPTILEQCLIMSEVVHWFLEVTFVFVVSKKTSMLLVNLFDHFLCPARRFQTRNVPLYNLYEGAEFCSSQFLQSGCWSDLIFEVTAVY